MAETIYYVDTDATGESPDGSSGNPYHTLNDAEQAQDADIRGGNAVAFNCRGATADVAAVTVSGWTTDSDSYVKIYTDQANRHDGKLASTKYRLEGTGGLLIIYEDYVRVDGVQIIWTSDGTVSPFSISLISATNNDIRISNSIIKGYAGTTNTVSGIYCADTDAILTIWNCLIYNISQKAAAQACAIYLTTATANIYGCTLMGGYRGLSAGAGTVTVKNTFVGNSASEDFYRAAGTLVKVNCASEDASADDTSGSDETASNCIINVAIDTDTFVDVTIDGGENFALAADGLSPLVGQGATLTDDPPGSTALGVDIIGTTRS